MTARIKTANKGNRFLEETTNLEGGNIFLFQHLEFIARWISSLVLTLSLKTFAKVSPVIFFLLLKSGEMGLLLIPARNVS